MYETGGSEFPHGPLDGVALRELLRVVGHLAGQLGEGELDGMEGEQLLEDRGLHGSVFLGGASAVVHLPGDLP
jgi:hypothetical protein